MEKDSAKQTKTRGSPALNRCHEQPRSASEEGVMIRGRKDCRDRRALIGRTELLKSEPGYNLRSRVAKRKATEGAPRAKRRRLSSTDKESCNRSVEKVAVGKRKASTDGKQNRGKKRRLAVTDTKPKTRQEVSVSALRESSNTSVEDVTVSKRKAATDVNQNGGKKRRLAVKDTKQKTRQEVSVSALRESSNTSVEDVIVNKRKAATDVNQNGGKKRRLAVKDTKPKTRQEVSIDALRAKFEAKYEQQDELGKGGCGCVFAGYRREDNLPVAIKRIPEDMVLQHLDNAGRQLSLEVAVMLRLQEETSGSVGAPVLLLDWYNLGQELILVHERPVPAEDLLCYVQGNGGSLPEEEAKIILKQLVDAAIKLQDHCIFHRDIKLENILIETDSEVPKVRLIDFGLSCFMKKGGSCRHFCGTRIHCPPEWNSCGKYSAGPTTVWQMGVVLFEMLHDFVIFMTTNFMDETLTISDMLSKECQDFLQACLMEDPDQRPTLKQISLHPWLN